jgi:hypothetical protein
MKSLIRKESVFRICSSGTAALPLPLLMQLPETPHTHNTWADRLAAHATTIRQPRPCWAKGVVVLLECFDHVPVLDPLMLLGRRVENVEIMRPIGVQMAVARPWAIPGWLRA